MDKNLHIYNNYIDSRFSFSQEFCNYIKKGYRVDISPWEFFYDFGSDYLSSWCLGIKNLYPNRNLVPFSKWDPSDDIACFDGDDFSGDPKVYYVHAFASPGWEDRGSVKNFDKWLEIAKKQSVEWQSEDN